MTKHETFSAQTPPFKTRYGNFINGAFEAPKAGRYFDNISPITGQKICEIPRSDKDDVEPALDAAHAAKDAWAASAAAERANILNKIADRMEANLALLAAAETSTTASRSARRPPPTCRWSVDHFRYFAGCVRAQEGSHRRDRPRHRRLSFP